MQEKVAIRATLQGEERLRHNFGRGGICAAALHLDLRNCTDAAASLCIETGTGSPSRGTHTVSTSQTWCFLSMKITTGDACLLRGQLKCIFFLGGGLVVPVRGVVPRGASTWSLVFTVQVGECDSAAQIVYNLPILLQLLLNMLHLSAPDAEILVMRVKGIRQWSLLRNAPCAHLAKADDASCACGWWQRGQESMS